jgi:Fur family ferric uptake transcriptional regulator
MCRQCDYRRLLESSGLECTPHRLAVLEAVGNGGRPLTAAEVFRALQPSSGVNRVTVYRILDLLVERRLVDRVNSGGRSFRYGLAPNANHPSHAHFFCLKCGRLECLQPDSLSVDLAGLKRAFRGRIEKAEVRLDGVCADCLAAG